MHAAQRLANLCSQQAKQTFAATSKPLQQTFAQLAQAFAVLQLAAEPDRNPPTWPTNLGRQQGRPTGKVGQLWPSTRLARPTLAPPRLQQGQSAFVTPTNLARTVKLELRTMSSELGTTSQLTRGHLGHLGLPLANGQGQSTKPVNTTINMVGKAVLGHLEQ